MVDFNQEATIGTPPGDLLKIIAMQKRAYFLDALEQYKKVEYKGQTEAEASVVCARMLNLFLELQAALFRTTKEKTIMVDSKPMTLYEYLQTLSYSKDVNDAIKAYYLINAWLDEKRITRLDTRQDYNRLSIETSNKVKGF